MYLELTFSLSEMEKTVLTRIDGKIYDFTDFADIHPGGHDAIRSCNMRDATPTFFHTHGRDKNVNMLIKKYKPMLNKSNSSTKVA